MNEYKEKILNALKAIKREGIDKLVTYLENETDFFTAPASTKYHSNYEGGLAEHSYKVMELFKQKNEQFNLNIPMDSIIICGLLHDLCKTNFYTKEKKNVLKGKKKVKKNRKINGQWMEVEEEVNDWQEEEGYTINDKLPLGHGCKSVILLQKFIQLTDFEIMAILFHMGIPEDYGMKQAYNKAVETFPAIIALHTSDYESSYFLEKTQNINIK